MTKEMELAKEQLEEIRKNLEDSDIKKVNDKIGGMKKGALKKVWDKITLLCEMVKDPKAEWESKAIALGALVYTIVPIDAIPDLLPALGFTDDAGVITAAIVALGAALKKYENKKDRINEVVYIESNTSEFDKTVKLLKVIVSVLGQSAHADGDLSYEENKRCVEIIDQFIFSDEGIFSDDKVKLFGIDKKNVKKIIDETLENPTSLKKIGSFAQKSELEETLYFYAFAIINVDENINKKERKFLDRFAKQLDLTKHDKKKIERNFQKQWLDFSVIKAPQ
ncbi:MAG: DUF533 domain-containing protein [Deltaproteobacteria bacterium]|nr:DUF533 domain-containing protein [Deltaproteobacteria bacterium]